MRPTPIALVTLTVLLAPAATPASAQRAPSAGWYAGASLGWIQTRFQPDYLTVADGERQRFENRASDVEGRLVVGHAFAARGRVALSVQADLAVNGATWTLSLPEEPSDFEYTLPWAAGVSVLPRVDLGGPVSFVGEVGGGLGRVHELKTSTAASRYDVDETTPYLVVGGGLALRLGRRFDATVTYRHRRYGTNEWETFDPSETLIERVSDAPRTHGVSITVVRRLR